ncbi:MAG TPA: putative LPS assembly protein LptD [Candidatus Eisenbacteria bacterium]|nr:putative LPS assembly protein LptD [Candidatus Eisenbacteria bacterium]
MNPNTCHFVPGRLSRLRSLFLVAAFAAMAVFAQQAPLRPPPGTIAEITARGAQRRVGSLYIADDDVEITYGGMHMRADHVEYNDTTSEAVARGHVIFDFQTQHLEGDEASYNVATGRGTFKNVRGELRLERRPNPRLLISRNPLYFEAKEVDRLSDDVYLVKHTWITICDPAKPTWQFYAPRAKITVQKQVALVNSNFRLYRIPLVWLPYATAPAGEHVRQSGFLLPLIGNSNQKGFVIGDAFYWAPRPWFDATLGFDYFSRRGTAQRGEFRARPFENTSIRYDYFGVIDRGLPQASGPPINQGGHQQTVQVQSLWNHGWRFVADVNELSSLTFRLAFSDTYGEAINSEIPSSIFLTNNFHGYSFNVASISDRSYLELSPANNVFLRSAPEARFSSVDRAPWRNLPVYLSFESFVGSVHREDQFLDTPSFVARTEVSPKVTIPIHFGDFLGVTASAAFRSTFYGDSLNSFSVLTGQSVTRNTGEFAVEFRPATLERFFDRPLSHHRYKHTFEPFATYRYVTGVHDFSDFIRFDSNATLTDTNEFEYGIMQHLFVKTGDDQPVDFLSWRIVQKHYFDPTFGGAIVPGQRNVFEALDSVTPFAFASTARNWSPIVSDVKLTPGGRYDAEQILEYDPQLQKMTTIGTLLKVKPYSELFFTVAHFRLQGDPIVQPLSQQIRAIVGYGDLTRKGFNASGGVSYDILSGTSQNEFAQVGYNGGCCGLSFEYRRINLGTVRNENQFRVAFILANLGSFGNLRRQERIY